MKKLLLGMAVMLASLTSIHARGIKVDCGIPAGNIVFERMSADTVYVHQDLRDTRGDWFYWAFRVCGAQGKTLTFVFTKSVAVGVRGPAVSTDRGRSYSYAAESGATRHSFTYTFPSGAREVWFYECHPYMPQRWESFVRRHRRDGIMSDILCQSRKGRDVPVCRFGRTDGQAEYRVVLSARHHCSETMADYVIEGAAESFMAADGLGEWLRAHMELIVVPFVDMDGAVEGDQGKNREPHDHNRDYTEFLYPETAALASLMKQEKPQIFIDVHCPWLYGGTNEYIYTPWKDESTMRHPDAEHRFSQLLEQYQEGGLRYKASDDLPFGVDWNTGANYAQGRSSIVWAGENVPSLLICRSLEVPFANANGAVVTPESAVSFGHGLAATFRALVEGK